MKDRILITLFVVLCSYCLPAQTVAEDGKQCFGYYPAYMPKEIKSLNDLPTDIKEKAINHLKKYLGEDFYKLLTFNGGIEISYSRLMRARPELIDELIWMEPAYDLSFDLKVPEAGIGFFCANLTLDSLGNVMHEIEFPQKKRGVKNTQFVSKDKIVKMAIDAGFPAYYIVEARMNRMVMRFEKSVAGKRDYILISAHTGKIIFKGTDPLLITR